MYVLGTAGHIDHGKSLLVKTLTGIDPDRLREEKERGMTIELGFAWLRLPSGREVGVVDVPGHERFVRHMLAGVGGIDLALLIVAANEGVMPQTREHLAILDIIGIRRGIIVITKKDLVDEDLLSLVKMEIEELVQKTFLAGAPIVPVSALTGEGLGDLLATIDRILDTTEPRPDLGRPRLPVDRIFTIAGAGTVVTGTLIDGSLAVGQEVEIIPSGIKTRIRALQSHKSKMEKVLPGSRVAANLVGVNKTDVKRGDVVTTPGWLKPTRLVTVRLSLLAYLKRPLRHGAHVSFHSLAAETMARIRLLGMDELAPGNSAWAQIVLEEPLAVIKGDRYIIRSTTETLGGGGVVDAQAKPLRRFRQEIIRTLETAESGTAQENLLALLEVKQPIEFSRLVVLSNLAVDGCRQMVASLEGDGRIIALGTGDHRLLFTASGWARLVEKTAQTVVEYHRRHPVRPGIPKIELTARLKLGNHAPEALALLVQQKVLIEEGSYLRLPSHQVKLTPEQQAQIQSFLKALAEHPYSPPSDIIPEPDVLGMLIEQGKVVKVSENIVFAASTYREMVARVTERIKQSGKVSLGEVRDMFQTSRKYAQALLEYLDGEKITRRVGDDRVLY